MFVVLSTNSSSSSSRIQDALIDTVPPLRCVLRQISSFINGYIESIFCNSRLMMLCQSVLDLPRPLFNPDTSLCGICFAILESSMSKSSQSSGSHNVFHFSLPSPSSSFVILSLQVMPRIARVSWQSSCRGSRSRPKSTTVSTVEHSTPMSLAFVTITRICLHLSLNLHYSRITLVWSKHTLHVLPRIVNRE